MTDAPKKRGGARPGGGRPKGIPNKATMERALIAEQVMDRAKMSGKKLGKEMIEEFAVLFGGIMARYQPQQIPGSTELKWEDKAEERFYRYGQLALKAASELASYQSPKVKAIMIHQAPTAPIDQPAQENSALSKMTPQQSYRMLKDADVIDMAETQQAKAKRAAGG